MTPIRFYNTLSKRIEAFEPVTPNTVRMYHCGPTVYDFATIGNFRSFLLGDLLRRFFEFVGFNVHQVMNITDVGHMTEDTLADGGGEDKMQVAMRRLKDSKKQGRADVANPDDPYQVAAYFTNAFVEDAKLLGLKVVADGDSHLPRATANVGRMIELIRKLIDSGHAYVAGDGVVYYDVASFPDYGKLSGNITDRLVAGAGGRITDAHQKGKRNPADFLLWKPDPSHVMKWDSPWGAGYPGWHIECSAMSMGVLGVETLDIHTGGEDNIFPHHECEIAQSTGATGKPFANYWLHTRYLLVEGEKMSKSKGNFFTLRDVLARGADPAVLRYELMRTHYRANASFTWKGMEDSAKAVRKLRDFAGATSVGELSAEPVRMGDSVVERAVVEALSDDLNISAALGVLFKWLSERDMPTQADKAAVRRLDGIFDVLRDRQVDIAPVDALSDDEIESKIAAINEARGRKDFATSDALRSQLESAGVEVQIGRGGATWRRKLAV